MCVASSNHEALEVSAASERIPLGLMDKMAASAPSSPSFLENVIRGTGLTEPAETVSVAQLPRSPRCSAQRSPAELLEALAEKRESHPWKAAVATFSAIVAVALLPAMPLASLIFLAVATCVCAAHREYRKLKGGRPVSQKLVVVKCQTCLNMFS